MESIRKFVADFQETGKKLHVLINNAGMTLAPKDTKRQYTKDNLEITMGTNHFGKCYTLVGQYENCLEMHSHHKESA